MPKAEKSMVAKEKAIISEAQFRNIVILIYIGTSIAIIPGAVTGVAKQDAWIAAVLGAIGGILLVLVYNRLVNKLKSMTIIEYIESILGRYFGKFIGMFLTFAFVIACATQLWILGDFLVTQIMPKTPMYVIHVLFIMVVVIGTRLGIEVIARSAEIVFPYIIIGITILVFSISPEIEFKNIQPVFEAGIKPLFKATLIFMASTSLTLVVLLMIFPTNSDDIKKGKRAFLIGTSIGGILLIGIVALTTLVLGADTTDRSTYPTYVLAKKIQIGEFLQRIEVILAMVWFITVFYKIIIYFYGSVLALSQVLALKDYRALTLPMAMIIVVLSLIVYPSLPYAQYWDATTWIPFVLTYALILPVLLLVIGIIRNKK